MIRNYQLHWNLLLQPAKHSIIGDFNRVSVSDAENGTEMALVAYSVRFFQLYYLFIHELVIRAAFAALIL